jgi:hypothetical protein
LKPASFIHAMQSAPAWSNPPGNQHIETHQQTERIAGTIVVNDGVIDDERAPWIQGCEGFGDQRLFLFVIPVVQNMAHGEDVDAGQILREEVAGLEADAAGEAVGFDILLEDGRDLSQIESDALKVRIGERNLDGEIALGGSDIGESFVAGPWDLARNTDICATAQAGHGGEEDFEASRVGVQSGKKVGAAGFAGLFCGSPVRTASVRRPQIKIKRALAISSGR